MENDVIYRQAAIDAMANTLWHCPNKCYRNLNEYEFAKGLAELGLKSVPSAQPEQTRIFVELVVEYPDPELCTYKEYRGKPYYSIKYIENGERYVGFGTYKPEVLSQYLKENFISSAQPDRSCIEQIKWERNLAIQQLNELGYSFGEAIRHDKDAISRKGAINAVCTVLYPDADKMNDAEKVLKEMPPAQPEQQWIPVSERLPEENMWTLCQNNAGAMMIGKYDIEFGWMFPAYFDGTVAWMPLPEQYREEEDMKANK